MMKEENLLLTEFGRKSHFSVPKGYFDHLAEQVLETASGDATGGSPICTMQGKPRLVRLCQRIGVRRIAIAASVVMVVGLGTLKVVSSMGSAPSSSAVAQGHHVEAASSGDTSFDEAADYTMLDNQDIYASLLSESNGF